mmetsp:Transcript_107035/g.299606  ORF Transcript_107035/g.299606 Transcript_107035/m.299606 type:complete len:518 (-) Transcript_107035:258-1811(-)
MLLGGVTFVMSIFRVVNWEDDDVRRYAWNVTSNTIAIFLAVLFFQGNKQMLDKTLDNAGVSEKFEVVVHIAHCGVYLGALLGVIGLKAGVWTKGPATWFTQEDWVIADAMLYNYGEKVTKEKVRAVIRAQKENKESEATSSVILDKYGLEIPVKKRKKEKEDRQAEIRCWATLLAHCAGFAAIAAGANMQGSSLFCSSPLLTLLPIGIITVLLLGGFQASNVMRNKLKKEAQAENRKGVRAALVQEACDEAEVDILALVLSFLLVQTLRFSITAKLPNEEGLEEPPPKVTMREAYLLWGAGLCILGAVVGLHKFAGNVVKAVEEEEEEGNNESASAKEQVKEKLIKAGMNALTMGFAWCLMWGSRYAWMANEVLGLPVTSIPARIVLALALSLLATWAICRLDKISDSAKLAKSEQAHQTEELVESIVASISLMVGFTWEHSFDGAVTDMAMLNKAHPAVTKFCMGLVVVGLLHIPWRRYILRKAIDLEALKKTRKAAEKARNKEAIGMQSPASSAA